MAKEKLSTDEKFEKVEFDLFKALEAIDRKDYAYYDRLTPEQQKKFVPFMMLHWVSAVKGNKEIQSYYLQSVNYHANTNMFNEYVQNHPKLQWLMLVAASPGIGKQYHQYIPHIRERVSKLKDKPTTKEIKEYFKKVYPKASDSDINMITKEFIDNQSRKVYLANKFPELKFDEIELLSEIITDQNIQEYEEMLGN